MTRIPGQYELWNASDALGRHALMAEILAQVSQEALQGDSLDSMLQAIVDCIARRLPISVASIILLNEQCTHFEREVWSGQVELAWPGEESWPVSKGVAGRCARSGNAQLVTNPEDDSDYVVGNSKVKTEYLVPIRHRERMHGVLNLESLRDDFFTPAVCAVFDAIAAQVAGVINAARLLEELGQANRRLHELSMVDGLTGIANRRCFDRCLDEEMDRHARSGKLLAMLLIDVDHFKLLNDAEGHLQGDECLRELSQLCKISVQSGGDVVARYGGDELVLLLPNCAQRDAENLAERLRAEVQAMRIPNPASPVSDCVTISIGVTTVRPDDSSAPGAVIAAADAALYEAKTRGRNRVSVRGAAASPAK
ncbi:MAG: diguanylate cyclase [Gammaproteobacteria bacterium]|nr:diguanylate cyclase [Gammaproteobacteria bacterium]